MIRHVVAVLALTAACGRDVALGHTAADAMPDGNGNPFTAGSYTIAFLDPSQQQCEGTLVGDEAAFASLTRAGLGFVDGTVTFATPTGTALSISGPPITMALGQASLDLAASSGAPPGLWDGLVTGDFSAGPMSTQRNATDLAADITTASAAMIDGQIAVLYATLDGMGDCTVVFGVTFTHP